MLRLLLFGWAVLVTVATPSKRRGGGIRISKAPDGVRRVRPTRMASAPDKMDLSSVSTRDLVDELHRRFGSSQQQANAKYHGRADGRRNLKRAKPDVSSDQEGRGPSAGENDPKTRSERGRFCRYVSSDSSNQMFVGLTAVFYEEPWNHIILENSAWNRAVARRSGKSGQWIQEFLVEGAQVTISPSCLEFLD